MASRRLKKLAEAYWRAREAQERDHTDQSLDFARTEAHDALLLQMRAEGFSFADREDAAQVARQILEGSYQRLPVHRRRRVPEQQLALPI